MKKILINTSLFFILLAALASCKKSYIKGGQIEDVNMYANNTNYEVLAMDPAYDTLIQLIDAAGLKDKINKSGTTFFAPSDYSILSYLQLRTVFLQDYVDQNAKFGLDSLKYYLQNNIDNTRDSLLMYQISTPLPYSSLTTTGVAYETGLAGDTVVVSYEPLGRNTVVSTVPRQVFFTQLWYHYNLSDANPASAIPSEIGVREGVITSGINTKSGIMNYLNNYHTLFFYATKQ